MLPADTWAMKHRAIKIVTCSKHPFIQPCMQMLHHQHQKPMHVFVDYDTANRPCLFLKPSTKANHASSVATLASCINDTTSAAAAAHRAGTGTPHDPRSATPGAAPHYTPNAPYSNAAFVDTTAARTWAIAAAATTSLAAIAGSVLNSNSSSSYGQQRPGPMAPPAPSGPPVHTIPAIPAMPGYPGAPAVPGYQGGHVGHVPTQYHVPSVPGYGAPATPVAPATPPQSAVTGSTPSTSSAAAQVLTKLPVLGVYSCFLAGYLSLEHDSNRDFPALCATRSFLQAHSQ